VTRNFLSCFIFFVLLFGSLAVVFVDAGRTENYRDTVTVENNKMKILAAADLLSLFCVMSNVGFIL